MHNFAAVIFDMDGLLLDSERLALETFEQTCVKFALGDHSQLYQRCIGTNTELGNAILREGLGHLVDFEAFSNQWWQHYEHVTQQAPVPLKSGVENLLQHLSQAQIPCAVATSTQTDVAIAKLRHSDIFHYFQYIVGGDQVQHSKPHPQIYLSAAEKLQVSPEHCLALEDSANGVKAALAAQMTVVQIPDLVTPDEALLQLGHIVLASVEQVIDYPFST